MGNTSLLFVYGTLMSGVSCAMGHSQRQRLALGAPVVGPASVAGLLFDLGAYPGLVLGGGTTEAGAGEACGRVFGEVRALGDDASVFDWLDRYEGIDANLPMSGEYRREVIVADLAMDGPRAGERVEAWTYIFQGPLQGARLIASGRWR